MASPDWFLDELAFAGRENLDPGHVELYDEKEDSAADEELALLRSLGLGERSIVVEFGSGSGQLALAGAAETAHWVAADVSPPMLDLLGRRREAAGLNPDRLVLARAGFLSYEHHGEPADFVYSRLALHHLPDFWKAIALARIRSILRPAGVLRLWDVVFSFDPADAQSRVDSWRESFPAAAGEGDWVRADLDEHLRDEHSTFTWLLEPMIERAGFEIEVAERSEDGIWASYVARAV